MGLTGGRTALRRASRRVFLLSALLGAALPALAGDRLTSASSNILRNVDAAQGQRSTGTGFALNTTVGEPAYAAAAGGALAMAPGYIPLSAQPGTVVSLTAVTKATGTLALAWTAPGADGSLGDVVNGFYRVDYSADPNHVFSPTTYVTEFSTTVTAGSSQQLEFTSLSPNTTYYAKIYLADARKVVAEDSVRGEQATLANAPDPAFSGVFPCSATITWPLPAGGVASYDTQGSLTNFGSLIKEQAGTQLSMTIGGLNPGTTYYFKVASLNWQSDKNFSVVVATVTPAGVCLPTVSGLAGSSDANARTITLTWSNPSSPKPQSIVVVVSTSSSVALTDGTSLAAGQTLPDGSTVKANGLTTAFGDTALSLDTTYYYHVFTQYAGPTYSVSVSTAMFLDLAPMTPANFTVVANSTHTLATLRWNAVASNFDGSAFKAAGSPLNAELKHYRIDRSTSVLNPTWVAVSTAAPSATTYYDDITGITQTLLYRVVSIDSLGNESPSVADDVANGGAYVYAADDVTHLNIPADVYQDLLANSPFTGTDAVIRSVKVAGSTDKTVNAVRFEVVGAVGSEARKPIQFSKPTVQVVLSYNPTVAARNLSVASAAKPADAVLDSMGLYWDNGSGSFTKLFGNVDATNQTVTAVTGLTGTYEVRPLARPTGFNFDISSLSNKFITPNGDGLNDAAVFLFDNPRDSGYSGKIYDLRGAYIADMSQGPIPSGTGQGSLQWDAKAGGHVVPGGVYVYVIQSEGKSFSGTLVVIR